MKEAFRGWTVVCLVVCIGLVSAVLGQQQPDGVTTVPVRITDMSDLPITGLQSKDFMVYENDRALEMRTFEKGSNEGEYLLGYHRANPNAGAPRTEVRVALPNVHVRIRADQPASK